VTAASARRSGRLTKLGRSCRGEIKAPQGYFSVNRCRGSRRKRRAPGSATTTHAVRAAIQRSKAPLKDFSRSLKRPTTAELASPHACCSKLACSENDLTGPTLLGLGRLPPRTSRNFLRTLYKPSFAALPFFVKVLMGRSDDLFLGPPSLMLSRSLLGTHDRLGSAWGVPRHKDRLAILANKIPRKASAY
jgi:hypothetical protein